MSTTKEIVNVCDKLQNAIIFGSHKYKNISKTAQAIITYMLKYYDFVFGITIIYCKKILLSINFNSSTS